jgi:hypothetical protein
MEYFNLLRNNNEFKIESIEKIATTHKRALKKQ